MDIEKTLHIVVDSLPSSGVSCIDILSALLTPMIGLIAIWIAYKQHKLHRDKFKLELFEKRHAVFNEARKFLSILMRDANLDSLDDLFTFRAGIADATFLFNDDITEMLNKIDHIASKLRSCHRQMEPLPKGEERSKLAEEIEQLGEQVETHLTELKIKFIPYLKLNNWQ